MQGTIIRKYLKIVLNTIIAVLTVLFCPFTCHAQAPNLLQNGGFESTLTNWSWGIAGGASASCVVSSTSHWGSSSASITYSGTLTNNTYGSLSQTVSGLTVGKSYTIYLWCNGTGVGTSEQVATGSQWQFRLNIPSGTYGWTPLALSFVADATTEPVMVLVQSSTTKLLVDDIALLPNPTNLTSLPSGAVPGGIGVTTHNIAPQSGELQMMYNAGIRNLRTDLNWSSVELTKGTYTFNGSPNYDAFVAAASQFGIRVYFIFDYNNSLYDGGSSPYDTTGQTAFASFAKAAVAHYQGKGVIWEIYNEPNGMWSSPGEVANPAVLQPVLYDLYGQLANVTATAIKSSYPNELVVGPAAAWCDSASQPYFNNTMSFLETCFEAPYNMCQHLNGISVHPYREDYPEYALADYTTFRNAIANTAYNNTGNDPQLICGEWGFTSTWFDSSGAPTPPGLETYAQAENTKANYISRLLLTNLSDNVNLNILYDWMDDGTFQSNTENNFGLVNNYNISQQNPTITPLDGYDAVQTLSSQLAGYTYATSINDGNADDFILCFTNGSKTRYVCWTEDGASHTSSLPCVASVAVTVTNYDGTWTGQYTSGSSGGFSCGFTGTPEYVVEAGQ